MAHILKAEGMSHFIIEIVTTKRDREPMSYLTKFRAAYFK